MIIRVDDNGTIKSAVLPTKTSDLTNDSGFMSDDYLVISTESSSPTDEERMEAIRLTMQSNGLLSYVGHANLSGTGSVWPIAAMFKDDYSAGSILRINWGGTLLLKYKYSNSTWTTDTYSNSIYGIKSISFTGTTNSNGRIEGALSVFGISGGTAILSAYFTRGSFSVRRSVNVYNYGAAGYGLEFYDNGTAVNTQSVTCTIYYI